MQQGSIQLEGHLLGTYKEILNIKVLKSIDDTVAPKSRLCVSIMLDSQPIIKHFTSLYWATIKI